MAQVGTLTVDLIAQTASFNTNIEKAARNLNSNANRMNASLSGVQKNIAAMRAEAEGLALGVAIKQAAEFVKRNLDTAGSLGEAAQQIGVTTRELQVFRAIGTQVGVTQEEMDGGLQKLTMSLGKASVGAKAQNDAFAALGISVRDASGQVKGTGEIVNEIADRLSKIANPAQRAAAEVAIFGRAGQKLDTILTGGRQGIEDYAQRAEDMGMVLSDDLVAAADAASDKLAELNAQLTANISKAVAENAGAILGLASALVSVTTSALHFIQTYPRLAAALAGAAVGSRFGTVGAVLGAAGGVAVGNSMAGSQADQNMDPKFRLRALNDARRDLDKWRNPKPATVGGLFTVHRGTVQGSGSLEGATAEVRRQTALLRQSLAPSLPTLPAAADLPNFLKPSGGGGRRARTPHAARDPLADAAERFGTEMARIDEEMLRVKRENLTDVGALAALDKQTIASEQRRDDLAVEKEVKDKRITEAQGQQLIIANDLLAKAKAEQIDREAMAERLHRSTELQIAVNDNELDVLQANESIAESAAERRRLGLQILDYEKRNAILKLQETIDQAKIGKATAEEAKAAQDALNRIDSIYAAKSAGVLKQTQGPLERYLDDNTLDRAGLNERVQGLVVEELEAVRHGIDDAITKTLGIKDPLLSGLIDMLVESLLIKPLAETLRRASGGGMGGGVGGLLSSALGLFGFSKTSASLAKSQAAFSAAFDQGFASLNNPFAHYALGTSGARAGFALVGENGPEVVKFRGGEQVVPNGKISVAGGGGNHYYFHGNLMTEEFWAQIRAGDEMAMRGGASLSHVQSQRSNQWSLAA